MAIDPHQLNFAGYFTKSNWLVKTVFANQTVFEDGKIIGEPKGRVITPR